MQTHKALTPRKAELSTEYHYLGWCEKFYDFIHHLKWTAFVKVNIQIKQILLRLGNII